MRRMWLAAVTVAVLVAAQVVVVGSGTAAALAGVEMVVARSRANSDSLKVVSARCPLGKEVLGGRSRRPWTVRGVDRLPPARHRQPGQPRRLGDLRRLIREIALASADHSKRYS